MMTVTALAAFVATGKLRFFMRADAEQKSVLQVFARQRQGWTFWYLGFMSADGKRKDIVSSVAREDSRTASSAAATWT